MSKINWKRKITRIPAKVQIAPGVWYDIHWQKQLVAKTTGTEYHGTTDYDEKIITLEMGMSPKLTVITYFHECLHAFSHEHGLNLTETQIEAMENIYPYLEYLFEKRKKK